MGDPNGHFEPLALRGPPRGPKRTPRGSQEARGLQEAPKLPPRGPQDRSEVTLRSIPENSEPQPRHSGGTCRRQLA
eukprot:9484398-Pyramimonas_sp.AAC.1